MIKPYLYGGLALLIVGLFSVTTIYYFRLNSAQSTIATLQSDLDTANQQIQDLKESERRKAAALDAYINLDAKINLFTNRALGIIKGYTKRDTPDEKCLDLSPPAELVRMLHSDSNKGSTSTP